MAENLQGMTPLTAIRLDRPGVLIAAIPALLGFNPADSLVVITHRGTGRRELGVVLRADLQAGAGHTELADQLVRPARLHEATAATMVVIDGGGDPHCYDQMLATVQDRFEREKMPVLHSLWAARIGAGAPWECLEDPYCFGEVEDPKCGPLAAFGLGQTQAANTTRTDLEQRIAPQLSAVLQRRAALLDGALAESDRADGVALFERVRSAAARCAEGGIVDDQQAAALAAAVRRKAVRDAVLVGRTRKEHAAFRELWTTLTSGLPEPECARAACLLAVGAYLDGDGAMTGIALERALSAEPGNRLANLLAESLRSGVPPERLRRGFTQLAEDARARLGVS